MRRGMNITGNEHLYRCTPATSDLCARRHGRNTDQPAVSQPELCARLFGRCVGSCNQGPKAGIGGDLSLLDVLASQVGCDCRLIQEMQELLLSRLLFSLSSSLAVSRVGEIAKAEASANATRSCGGLSLLE